MPTTTYRKRIFCGDCLWWQPGLTAPGSCCWNPPRAMVVGYQGDAEPIFEAYRPPVCDDEFCSRGEALDPKERVSAPETIKMPVRSLAEELGPATAQSLADGVGVTNWLGLTKCQSAAVGNCRLIGPGKVERIRAALLARGMCMIGENDILAGQ